MIWLDALKGFLGVLKVPEFDTASPPVESTLPAFRRDGTWRQADREVDPHPYRLGGTAWPGVVVVHTTDMMPNTFEPLLKQWHNTPGAGACANLLIGRDSKQGVVQLTPFGRNGNHAGGPTHGNFYYADPAKGIKPIHPNLVSYGIEVHGAGRLYWKKGSGFKTAQFIEGGKVKGEFGNEDVYIDGLNRPWHLVTEYQLERLDALLADLKPVLTGTDFVVKASGNWKDEAVGFAEPILHQLMGHASLDPVSKSDPGPQLMDHINTRGRALGYV